MNGPETNVSPTIFEKCGGKLAREGRDAISGDPLGIPLPTLHVFEKFLAAVQSQDLVECGAENVVRILPTHSSPVFCWP